MMTTMVTTTTIVMTTTTYVDDAGDEDHNDDDDDDDDYVRQWLRFCYKRVDVSNEPKTSKGSLSRMTQILWLIASGYVIEGKLSAYITIRLTWPNASSSVSLFAIVEYPLFSRISARSAAGSFHSSVEYTTACTPCS